MARILSVFWTVAGGFTLFIYGADCQFAKTSPFKPSSADVISWSKSESSMVDIRWSVVVLHESISLSQAL